MILLAFPISARAGTASVRVRAEESRSDVVVKIAEVRYKAGRGERNGLSVRITGRAVKFTDSVGIRAGRGCKKLSRRTARCSLRSVDGSSLTVALGDRADSVRTRGKLRYDEYASNGRVTVRGGPGADRILGGPAQNDPNTLAGGSGNDTVIGGSGEDVFDEGPRASGSDTIDGRGGEDEVTYPRSRGVSLSADGQRNDGEPGESDLLTSVENLTGGRGSDVITGGPARDVLDGGPDRATGRKGDVIDGGAGADQVNGSGGADTIIGGEGEDTIAAGRGDDRVLLRDGRHDDVECGSGTDTIELDGYDTFTRAARCEIVQRAVHSGPVLAGIREFSVSGKTPRGSVYLSCSPDAPRPCAAQLTLTVGGMTVAAGAITVSSSADPVSVQVDPAFWARVKRGDTIAGANLRIVSGSGAATAVLDYPLPVTLSD